MTDWAFRKQRWNTFKLGREHGKRGVARADNLIEERFRKAYKDGYVEGAEIKKARTN